MSKRNPQRTSRICKVDCCAAPHEARGYCVKHLRRFQNHGSAFGPIRAPRPRPRRADGVCVIAGCPSRQHRREWCRAHYRRWRLCGDPEGVEMRRRRHKAADIDAVFWSQVHKTDDCWLWTSPSNGSGYGAIKVNGRTVMAHRYAWEQVHGPVPTGRELDHLCRMRLCVRPDHLEPVTHQENARRKRIAPKV